jgi:outer membrane protein OmpA-like peptidoglycan-associated protein
MKKVAIFFAVVAILIGAGCHKNVVKTPDLNAPAYERIMPIHFEAGKVVVSGHGYAELIDAIDAIRQSGGAKFVIVGHAGEKGSAEAREELAVLRARSVLQYLIGYGFGAGAFNVKVVSDKPDGDNRIVEILVDK